MPKHQYMERAILLAQKGIGWVSPNPLVGAVIVKGGQIIGEGYHRCCGEAHAERNALSACTEDPSGATMYVTLEPCCHVGRQPPCVEAILNAGISQVVIGSHDPNPMVNGGGAAFLKGHGISVETGFMREQCDALNPVFFHYIRTKRPYVVMKYAMTLDGKIAAWTGESKWITSAAARAHVQTLRHRYRAIMVGLGTILTDNPMLTFRITGGRTPIRIICDTHLQTPLDSAVVQTAHDVPTILATCCTDWNRHRPYQACGCEIIITEEDAGHVNLVQLMELLSAREIDSLLLEGGSTLNWAALECGIVCSSAVYIAPKLLGGQEAISPIAGRGFSFPDQAAQLKITAITRIGEDILIESEVENSVYRYH